MAGITNANARSSSIDAVLATTLDKFYKSGKMHDAIFKSNPTFAMLKEAGRIEYVDGGYQIAVNLMYGKNTTVGSYSKYEVLDVAPQDGMTQALYPWAQYSGALSIDGLTEFQNAGAGRIIRLGGEKAEQTTMSFSETLNEDLWDYENLTAPETTGNGGKNINSIPLYVTDDTTFDPGGIDASTYSWWQAKAGDFDTYGADSWAGLLRAFDWLSMEVAKGTGGRADVYVTSPNCYLNIEEALFQHRRFTSGESASFGFPTINHKGAKIFWDEHVPDIKTNVNWDSGSYTEDSIFALNTKFLKLCMARGKDFRPMPFQAPVDQDARTALYIAYLQLVCSNRRKQGVLYDVEQAITS